jgi:S-methylmethionine-dependent homocysteine/selenocysteine methylase
MKFVQICAFAPPAGDYDSEGNITPAAYLSHAKAWHAAGAELIGGCCGVGPQHMQLVAQHLCPTNS